MNNCTHVNPSGLGADSLPPRSTTSCPRPRPLTSRPLPLPCQTQEATGGTTSWRQDTTIRRRTPSLQTTLLTPRAVSQPQLGSGSCRTSVSTPFTASPSTCQPHHSRYSSMANPSIISPCISYCHIVMYRHVYFLSQC